MMKSVHWCMTLVLLSITACGSPEPPSTAPAAQPSTASAALRGQRAPFVERQVIVKLRDGVLPSQRTAARRLGAIATRHVKELSEGAMLWTVDGSGDAAADTLAAVAALQKMPEVEYAHVNARMSFFSTPTDPDYPLQWNYPAINLPAAWNVVTGSSNIRIAIIDSGQLPHPDLQNKWVAGQNFGDAISSDATDTFLWHHGLHVAGIAAASSNNGIGGAGICQGCSLMPIKIEQDDQGDINIANVGQAISWATANGARVINMSFGTTDNASPCSGFGYIQTAVSNANAAGVVVVAAAGNITADVANVTPASCNGVLAVAASDRSNTLASYSNRGTRIDVTAPGGGTPMFGSGSVGSTTCPADGTDYSGGTAGVVSSWAPYIAGRQLASTDYCYRYLSGTSMASPHVAGVAALIKSQFPTIPAGVVADRIRGTATAMPGCGANCGAGLLNAGAAVYAPNDSPCRADGDMCLATANECHLKGGAVLNNLPCRTGVCCGL